MRLHRLEVEGFGPFRDQQVVDFDAFARDGIFLIGGKTGAGKSSILDAVCFALYGGVPRYEDGEKRLRSDHSSLDEPTRVRLEFSSGDRRLRIERVPTYERRKRSGHGTTQSPAEARLEEWIDGGWVGLAARPVDVGNELGPILGLNQQQFLQVILLAQGRFSRFLLAKNDERQAVLRTLFDSHRFEGYEAVLERRRRETADRLVLENRVLMVQLDNAEGLMHDGADEREGADGEAAGVEPAGDVTSLSTDQRLELVSQARMRAAHARELSHALEQTAKDAHAAADAAHAVVVAQQAGQQRRSRARAALGALEDRAEAIAAARAERTNARDAELLRGPIEAAHRAAAALVSSAGALERSRQDWLAATSDADQFDVDADAVALDRHADELAGDVGAFRIALEAEQGLDALVAERSAMVTALGTVDTELGVLDARRGELPGLFTQLTAAIAEAGVQAAALAEAEARVAEARARVAAAREVEARKAVVAEAQAHVVSAGRALTGASAALDSLRERRFRDHAGELADLLVAGDPCPVCGSCEHPAPTPRGDDPVTDELVAAAEAAKDAAVTADATAAAALRAAEQSLAAAATQAGGLSIAEADAEVAVRETAERAAADAMAQRGRLEDERALLEEEAAALTSSYSELSAGRTAAATTLDRLDQAIDSATATIATARADHDSVAARIADTERRLTLARSYAAAQRSAEAHQAAAAEALAELAGRITASPFADEAAVTSALRDPSERERLDVLLRAHDEELASQRRTLLELELEMLPEEPVDVAAAESALQVAADEWRAAIALHTEAARRAAQLDEASAAAHIAHEAIAELAEEADVIERLANSVAGRAPNTLKMNLETFVLAAELEEIVAAANVRLDEMSQSRYRLQHTDSKAARGAASGLGIEVLDAYTGHARPVQSLSGGETFLASLALALGLAEVVTARAGGIRLDTLFIDEGFGSLDADTLDIAMRTLDELRQGGRVIGVISHVEAMKDQLPAQLLVETTDQGPSVIRQESAIPV